MAARARWAGRPGAWAAIRTITVKPLITCEIGLDNRQVPHIFGPSALSCGAAGLQPRMACALVSVIGVRISFPLALDLKIVR